MAFRTHALTLCLALITATGALAQSARTPAPGSEERAAIMDALRVPAEKEFKQKVIFKVDTLRVAGDWAYAKVSPTKPNGDEIDFSKTKYREQVELGAFDPQGEALLRIEGGDWRIVEWAFGSTDVPSVAWAGKHKLPKSLLR